MWQALHTELESKGLTIVTVALDVNPEDAKPWIELARPGVDQTDASVVTERMHPALIDSKHVIDELFGITNVPMAVWIDETGKLVRPAEKASVEPPVNFREVPENLPDNVKQIFSEVAKFKGDSETYLAAIHDWVAKGSDSSFALSADEVVALSRPLPIEHAQAAACFELGQWHWGQGNESQAVKWWREAHRLDPSNWTYKRQAWTFVTTTPGEPPDLLQAPNDVYEGSWFSDLMAQGGGETYYDIPTI